MPIDLTPRERSLLRLIALGYDSAGIEAELGISSARSYVARLCQRFGAKTRVQLLAIAFREGQLPPPDEALPEIERFRRIRLLDQEHNLLLLLAFGHSHEAAAPHLGMAEVTFGTHQSALVDKIGVPPRVTHRPRRNYVVAHALWAGTLRLDRPFVDPRDPDERERRLLQHLAAGDRDTVTGAALGIRPTSTDNEIQKIRLAWGCASRTDLLQLMIAKGIITVPASRWPSIAAMLEHPPTDQEGECLNTVARNISREQAAAELGIRAGTYRAVIRELSQRYHAQTKAQLTATILLTEAVRTWRHLPLGVRFLNSAFVPTPKQSAIVAGLATGRPLSDISFQHIIMDRLTLENEKRAMLRAFGVGNLWWELLIALHAVGQLPMPSEPAQRRRVEQCIIQPPPRQVRVVLHALVAGQTLDSAMIRAGLQAKSLREGLTNMGAQSVTQGVAMYCWVGDSWRGR